MLHIYEGIMILTLHWELFVNRNILVQRKPAGLQPNTGHKTIHTIIWPI